MNLFDALTAVAAHTGLNAEKLMEYADEWQGDNERAFLYAIVRALRPVNSLELGTHTGEGASCIVQAILDGLGTGKLTTVDILDEPHIASAIPTNLRSYVTLVTANIDEWVANQSGYDFIFDDGSHSIHQVHQIYGRLDQLLNAGGIIMSHDAAAGGVGDYIHEGQTKSGYDLPVYVIDPLPWGFSVYRKPGWDAQGVGQSPTDAQGGSSEATEGNRRLPPVHNEVAPQAMPPANPATEDFIDDLKDPAGVKKIVEKPRKNPRTRKGSTK